MGLGKFWPDLEISEAFFMSLDFSFSGDFDLSESLIFFGRPVSESRIYGQIMLTHLGIDRSWFLNIFVAAK